MTLAGLATAFVVVSVALSLSQRGLRPTSYFALSPINLGLGLAAGSALVLVALLRAREGPWDASVRLAFLAGCVWLAPVWVGWDSGPGPARSAAMVAVPLFLPVLAHLALALSGPVSGAAGRGVAALYAVVAGLTLALAAVRDPFLDRYCWNNCTTNSFLIRAEPVAAGVLAQALAAVTVLAGVAFIVLLWCRVRDRWTAVSVATPSTLALAGAATTAALLLRDPREDAQLAVLGAQFLVQACGLLGVALGMGRILVARRRSRAGLARLTRALSESAGAYSLESELARTLEDESLRVHYWLPERGVAVDGVGQLLETANSDVRGRLIVVRGGRPAAMITYDPQVLGSHHLPNRIGSSIRLMIDNERLRAQSLSELRELRDSRARIVAATDQARRALERDLHDGVQQRLLALTYELRLAQDECAARARPDLTRRLDGMLTRASESLVDLRAFAHGVFPAVLDQTGLSGALPSLAEEATLPIDIYVEEGRYPREVERTAYLAAARAIDAADPASDQLLIIVSRRGEHLVVEASGVGAVDATHLADRAGAIGGQVSTQPGLLRVEVPCGSS